MNHLEKSSGKQGGLPDFNPITAPFGMGMQLYQHLFMHPMVNYNHQRRLGILTDLDNNPFTVEMGGEQMRQSTSAGITQTIGDIILSGPEKIIAGLTEADVREFVKETVNVDHNKLMIGQMIAEQNLPEKEDKPLPW